MRGTQTDHRGEHLHRRFYVTIIQGRQDAARGGERAAGLIDGDPPRSNRRDRRSIPYRYPSANILPGRTDVRAGIDLDHRFPMPGRRAPCAVPQWRHAPATLWQSQCNDRKRTSKSASRMTVLPNWLSARMCRCSNFA